MPEQPKHPNTKTPREREAFKKRAPQDVPDPRVKGSGHKKKTADKWNQ
jgi:hypothetical protein